MRFQNIASDARQMLGRRNISKSRFQNHASDTIFCDHALDVEYESGYVQEQHLNGEKSNMWRGSAKLEYSLSHGAQN